MQVLLQPKQTIEITFTLSARDVSIWDVGTHAWQPQAGMFTVYVGASSQDIRLQGQVQF